MTHFLKVLSLVLAWAAFVPTAGAVRAGQAAGRAAIKTGNVNFRGLTPVQAGVKLAVHHLGVVPFMKAMAQKQTVKVAVNGHPYMASPTTLKKFWQNKKDSQWLEDQFRAADPNQHEFIPSNRMMEVTERASTKGLKWIDLQNEMRISTSDVIFKPSKTKVTATIAGKAYAVPQGHSGALYEKRVVDGKKVEIEQTAMQPEFHDDLRKAFESSKTIPEAVAKVRAVVKNWIWDGSAIGMPIDPHITRRDGSPITRAEQAKSYQSIMTMLDKMAKL